MYVTRTYAGKKNVDLLFSTDKFMDAFQRELKTL